MAKTGVYHSVSLPKRYNQKQLPSVEIVDLKKEIRNGTFDPFGGYMEDQHGNVRCQEDEFLSTKQIINMDWLLDNVVGYIPDIQRFSEASRLLMQTEGMKINNNTKKQEK